MKSVTVIQRRMTHYRVAFFETLRRSLESVDIELRLAYGRGTPEESSKRDSGEIDWAHKLDTRYFLGGRVCYQPIAAVASRTDMLVVALENKLICNLYYQYCSTRTRIGLWGHGANLQGDPRSFREKYKRHIAAKADWWFGYTQHSLPLISAVGFPSGRVSILNNSIDTAAMREQFLQLTESDRGLYRAALGIGSDAPVAAFVGSLYSEKRVEFMLDCARRVRLVIPDFNFIIVGSGPDAKLVEDFTKTYPWVKYLGARTGLDKVSALHAADIVFNPGLVGLGILDSFVCERPLFTTDCGLHSPEIVYLESGENGAISANDVDSFVGEVSKYFRDASMRERLVGGCRRSANLYTIDNMASNFSDGVQACLAAPIWRVKN